MGCQTQQNAFLVKWCGSMKVRFFDGYAFIFDMCSLLGYELVEGFRVRGSVIFRKWNRLQNHKLTTLSSLLGWTSQEHLMNLKYYKGDGHPLPGPQVADGSGRDVTDLL